MEVWVPDLVNGYVEICREVALGDHVAVREQWTRELTGITLGLNDPTVCTLPIGVERAINTRLAAVEALCMIGGTWRQDLIAAAAPDYAKVLVDDDPIRSVVPAYGPRIRDQLPLVVDTLREDPSTRQALIQIWEPDDLSWVGDKPCTITLQFILRAGRLQCHVNMRSQDVWLGLGMDVFVFTQLQLTVCNALGVPPGQYVHHVGSLHAYDRDLDKIANLKPTERRGLPTGWPHGVLCGQEMAPMQRYMRAARQLLKGYQDHDNGWYLNRINQLKPGSDHA
jgi:thymidylate synthase